MTKAVKKTSPLGHTSNLYHVKSNEHGSILDQPEVGLLELYPAGYTKPSNRDGHSRQIVYQRLYEFAVAAEKEDNIFPFEKDSHNIDLLPDPNNPYDKNAIHLILRINDTSSPLRPLDGADLGFIPKKINQMVLKNIGMFNGVRLLKVKANFHKKFYGAKVVLAYGEASFLSASKQGLSRFTDLLEE